MLTIGQVADAVGMTTATLRHYDDVGLVPPTARVSGRRRYEPAVLRRLDLVRRCQAAGFTLSEIRQLLDGDGDGDWQDLARQKRLELQERITELEAAGELIDAALACGCQHLETCERSGHRCLEDDT